MAEPYDNKEPVPFLVRIVIEGVVQAKNATHAQKLMETGVTTPLCLQVKQATIDTISLETIDLTPKP